MGKMCIKRWGGVDEGYTNIVECGRYEGKSRYYGKDHILGNKAFHGLLLISNWGFFELVHTDYIQPCTGCYLQNKVGFLSSF